MACYYPMEALKFYDGSVKVTGSVANGFHSKKWNSMDVREFLQVPCGKCVGCRLEYSRQWAIRCMNELETTEGQCWFVTLTYDNEHLPTVNAQFENSGYKLGIPTLKPEDLTNFVKALRESQRRRGKTDVRFFACGEYGELFKRPHFHIIFFNLDLDDLEFKFAKKGHEYYTSKYIDSIWKKGIVDISDVNFECCAYVARYVMKKAMGPNGVSYASDHGIVEEFTRMSRRPGIGHKWYELHKDDLFKKDYQIIYTNKGALTLQPAKYYDKLFDVEYPEVLEDLKDKRKLKAERKNALIMSRTSVSSMDYRGILQRAKEDQISILHRDFD